MPTDNRQSGDHRYDSPEDRFNSTANNNRFNKPTDNRATGDGRFNSMSDGRFNSTSDGRYKSSADTRFNSEYEVLDRPTDVDMEDENRCKYVIGQGSKYYFFCETWVFSFLAVIRVHEIRQS
jgi:hypothetical protein